MKYVLLFQFYQLQNLERDQVSCPTHSSFKFSKGKKFFNKICSGNITEVRKVWALNKQRSISIPCSLRDDSEYQEEVWERRKTLPHAEIRKSRLKKLPTIHTVIKKHTPPSQVCPQTMRPSKWKSFHTYRRHRIEQE